jgi:hypothetical protein
MVECAGDGGAAARRVDRAVAGRGVFREGRLRTGSFRGATASACRILLRAGGDAFALLGAVAEARCDTAGTDRWRLAGAAADGRGALGRAVTGSVAVGRLATSRRGAAGTPLVVPGGWIDTWDRPTRCGRGR